MGGHWYFRIGVKTADNTDTLWKCKALKQILQHAPRLLIVVHII